jgi:transcriptional regulator with XRE-family HTH domain
MRTRKGLLLKFVAAEMGIKSNYLSMLESGQRNWSAVLVDKFKSAIGK